MASVLNLRERAFVTLRYKTIEHIRRCKQKASTWLQTSRYIDNKFFVIYYMFYIFKTDCHIELACKIISTI